MNSEIFLSELNEILQRPITSTEFLSQVTEIQVEMLNYQNKRRKLRDLGQLIAIDFDFERKEYLDISDTEDSILDLSDIFDQENANLIDTTDKQDQLSSLGDLESDIELIECVDEGTVLRSQLLGENINSEAIQAFKLEDTKKLKRLQLPKNDSGIYLDVVEKHEFSPKEDQVCPNDILMLPRFTQTVPDLKNGKNKANTQVESTNESTEKKRKREDEPEFNVPMPPSVLDKRQHQFYLECLHNNEFRQNNILLFKEINQIVQNERYQYRIVSQALLSLNRKVFDQISTEAEQLYEAKMQERLKRVTEDYNMNMQCIKCVEIETDYTRGNILQYKETLLKLGQCGKVTRNLNMKLTIPDVQKVSPPVMTMDLNVEMLLKDNDIEIAMSSSSFNALISAVAQSPGFEIPVVIKIMQQKHRTTKVIIIDKSLAMAKQTPRDKMLKYYKNAIKQFNREKGELWYNVWKFGKFNILLRTKQETQMEIDGQVRNVNIQPKLEYIPSNGQEVITEYEKIKWWASTFVKPNATLMLAKIHPSKDIIIDNQEKRMDHLIEDGSFPVPFSNGLYEIFTELQRLQPGVYYIAKKRNGKKISIFETTSTKTKYFPNELIITGIPVNPMPVYEWRQSHIPYTFPPNDIAPSGKTRLPFKVCNQFLKGKKCKGCQFAHVKYQDYHQVFQNSRFLI
ncbi:hypothetical protein HDV06_001633 [Boothiomyces sp. JEL0866]|nr:hypothetical protein HDV06_001633 [Boothiomyces sp. JEL0866]